MPANLGGAAERQEGFQIGCGNSHRRTKTMRDEFAAIDPTANRTSAYVERIRDLGDGEEFDCLMPATASASSWRYSRASLARRSAGSSASRRSEEALRFCRTTGGVDGSHQSAPYPEVGRTDLPIL